MAPKAKAEQGAKVEVVRIDPYTLPYVEVEPAGFSLLKVRMREIETGYFEMYR